MFKLFFNFIDTKNIFPCLDSELLYFIFWYVGKNYYTLLHIEGNKMIIFRRASRNHRAPNYLRDIFLML